MKTSRSIPFGLVVLLVFGAGIFALWHASRPYTSRLFPTGRECPPDCNVILISIDSLRRDHLGLYGYTRSTSPNLDQWAVDAFVFDQYITAAYLTPISEMALHTGRYPSSNGMIGFASSLREDVPTLTEILRAAGYTTVAMGSSPEFFYERSIPSENLRQSFRRGFDSYFEDYFNIPGAPLEAPDPKTQVANWREFAWPKIYRGLPMAALEWLSRAPTKKFFLWLTIGTVHWPYNNGEPFVFGDAAYQGILREDQMHWWSKLSRIYKGRLWQEDGSSVPLAKEDLQFIIDRYDDGIFLGDQFLGEFFKIFEAAGLGKNTIVIIASEHGEEMGERGHFSHYDISDATVRTPLIIKIPGTKGGKIAGLISSVDVLPTLLEIINLPSPPAIDGMSFAKVLFDGENSKISPRSRAFIERTPLWQSAISSMPSYYPSAWESQWIAEFNKLNEENHYRNIAVRTNEWKLIFRESHAVQEKYDWWGRLSGTKVIIPEYELYNVVRDPSETKNVIEQYPEIAAPLKAELLKWKAEMDAKKQPQQKPTSPIKLQPYF